MTQLAATLASRPRATASKNSAVSAFGDQDAGVVGSQAIGLDEARRAGIRQFRQVGAKAFDVGLVKVEGQQVRVREITIVVGVLLAAHGPGLAAAGIEEAGFLHHLAAVLVDLDLALGLILDRLHDETHRIHVLDLGPGAQGLLADRAHRDVDVAAHGAFLHVAVAGAEIAQDRAQFAQVGAGLLRAPKIGLGDDLHQRHPRAVEVDEGAFWVLVVQGLAGVLLHVQALDTDGPRLAVGQIEDQRALADNRLQVLRNLIALGQIGIEIVLTLEHRVAG